MFSSQVLLFSGDCSSLCFRSRAQNRISCLYTVSVVLSLVVYYILERSEVSLFGRERALPVRGSLVWLALAPLLTSGKLFMNVVHARFMMSHFSRSADELHLSL